MTDEDHDIRLVICDFGLATFETNSAVPNDHLAKRANIQGFSPRYAAPEVFQNFHSHQVLSVPLSQKGDIYAYSIILWELLTRNIPWKDLSLEETEAAVLKGERPIVPVEDEDPLRNVLREVMQVCWAQESQKRPAINEVIIQMEPRIPSRPAATS